MTLFFYCMIVSLPHLQKHEKWQWVPVGNDVNDQDRFCKQEILLFYARANSFFVYICYIKCQWRSSSIIFSRRPPFYRLKFKYYNWIGMAEDSAGALEPAGAKKGKGSELRKSERWNAIGRSFSTFWSNFQCCDLFDFQRSDYPKKNFRCSDPSMFWFSMFRPPLKIRVFASTLAKAFAEAVEWPQQMTE